MKFNVFFFNNLHMLMIWLIIHFYVDDAKRSIHPERVNTKRLIMAPDQIAMEQSLAVAFVDVHFYRL